MFVTLVPCFSVVFLSGVAAYANGARYVIACFVLGTLVASLQHSGFLLALGSWVPCDFVS